MMGLPCGKRGVDKGLIAENLIEIGEVRVAEAWGVLRPKRLPSLY
jgi:hypothetical protein